MRYEVDMTMITDKTNRKARLVHSLASLIIFKHYDGES